MSFPEQYCMAVMYNHFGILNRWSWIQVFPMIVEYSPDMLTNKNPRCHILTPLVPTRPRLFSGLIYILFAGIPEINSDHYRCR